MPNKVEHTYVLTLSMNTTDFDLYRFDKVFEVSRKIQNACLGEIVKRDRIVRDNKKYRKNIRCIMDVKRKINYSKNKKEITILEKELRSLNEEQKVIEGKFGLSEYAIHDFVAPMKRHFQGVLDINTAQKIATRAWGAYQKTRYGSGKKFSFKKYGTMTSIEGKTNKSGITFRESKGQYVVNVMGTKVPVIENRWISMRKKR